MKLKTVEVAGKTYAEIVEGKPVYVHDDGKEVGFDAPATVAKIGQLNGEAKTHREAKEAAEAKLRSFDGITDPAAARTALETVKNLDAKKLVDAGEVETIKREAARAAEERVAAQAKTHAEEIGRRDAAFNTLQNTYNSEKLSGHFTSSKFVNDKFAIPPDFVEARFAKHFKVEDGKIVGYHNDKDKIYSRSKPGEVASFDEALETLVDSYPDRDRILKGSGASGGGARGGNGSGGGGQKTMTRAQYEADIAGGAAKIAQGYSIVD